MLLDRQGFKHDLWVRYPETATQTHTDASKPAPAGYLVAPTPLAGYLVAPTPLAGYLVAIESVVAGWESVCAAILAAPPSPPPTQEDKQGSVQWGLEINSTTKLTDKESILQTLLPSLSLIAIRLENTGDGRGFSLARLLRGAGFTGTLRAVGALIPDQMQYALLCGFDTVEIADAQIQRHRPETWLNAISGARPPYQDGYATPNTILNQRRLARSVSATRAGADSQ